MYYVTLVFCTTSTETCFMKIHLPEYNISNIMGSTGFPPNTDRQGPLESYNNIVYGKSYRERLSKTKLNRYSHIETSANEGQDFGKLSKLWEKMAVSESKLEMMGRMLKSNVGFNEIEDFVNKIERKINEKESNGGEIGRARRS